MRRGRPFAVALAIAVVLAFGGCAAASPSGSSESSASQSGIASAVPSASESAASAPASGVAANAQTQAQAFDASPSESHALEVSVDGTTFYATFAESPAADELAERLAEGPVTVSLRDYGGFEKVGPLPWSLSANGELVNGLSGDILLYQGNQVTIFYGSNSYSYTRLAHVDGATAESLRSAFGDGDVEVTLSLG